MRRSFTLIAPVITGALVLSLAAAYPASAVRGSALTGPKAPQSIVPAPLGRDYRLHWSHTRDLIVLRVRDGALCMPRLQLETSTAPGRIEVDVARPTGPTCRLRPRWWALHLLPPTLRATWQPVDTYVNGARTTLRAPHHLVPDQGTVQ